MKPFLTTPNAADYLGFKTTGAVRKAVKEGRLRPAGRRGGTGPYVFALAELDRFLLGGGAASLHSDRPGAPSNEGVPNGQEIHQETRQLLGEADTAPRRIREERRRLRRARPSERFDDRSHARDPENPRRGNGEVSLRVVGGRESSRSITH